MTEDNRRAAIAQELKLGQDALSAAKALRDLGLGNDSLSRLYYAMFHYVVALLLTQGIEPRRHRALPGLVATHFGSVLSAADVVTVGRVAGYRDLADYERAFIATREVVDAAFAEVEPLVARILAILAQGGWSNTP